MLFRPNCLSLNFDMVTDNSKNNIGQTQWENHLIYWLNPVEEIYKIKMDLITRKNIIEILKKNKNQNIENYYKGN